MLTLLSYISKIEFLVKKEQLDSSKPDKRFEEHKKQLEEVCNIVIHHYNYLSEASKNSWFCKLPLVVQVEILKKLNNIELSYFSFLFPQYLWLTIQPTFWRNFDIYFASHIINREEVFLLASYLNVHLNSLQISLSTFENLNYKELFKLVPNLSTLKISCSYDQDSSIVSDIVTNFSNLRRLAIHWIHLTNHHLFEICNSYPNLYSIEYTTQNNIDTGCLYMINKMKNIIDFHINSPFLSSKTLKTLFDKHAKSLIKFYFEIHEIDNFDSDSLLGIRKATNLKQIYLGKLVYSDQLFNLLAELDSLVSFGLSSSDNYPPTNDITKRIFTHPKYNIDSYYINNTNLNDEGFEILAKNCHNVDKFILCNCLTSEYGLKKTLTKINAKSLKITLSKYSIYTIVFDFLKEIPHEILINTNVFHVEMTTHEDLISRIVGNFEYFSRERKMELVELIVNSKTYYFK